MHCLAYVRRNDAHPSSNSCSNKCLIKLHGNLNVPILEFNTANIYFFSTPTEDDYTAFRIELCDLEKRVTGGQ